MKRSAIIKKFREEWKSAESDFGELSRNGLAVASTGKPGLYYVEKAVAWAKEKGKFIERNIPPSSILSAPVSKANTLK
jgi:hypothetical protein